MTDQPDDATRNPARDDLEDGADAGAISGRAVTRQPHDLAPGDTLGGGSAVETGDDVPETDANMAQADPLSGNPPAR